MLITPMGTPEYYLVDNHPGGIAGMDANPPPVYPIAAVTPYNLLNAPPGATSHVIFYPYFQDQPVANNSTLNAPQQSVLAVSKPRINCLRAG